MIKLITYIFISKTWDAEDLCLANITTLIVKKTVAYHLVNGCRVLLHIKNSKNDRLKVILLVAVWLNVMWPFDTAHEFLISAPLKLSHYLEPSSKYTHNTRLFYGSVEFVRDNPGEPVPEETFTH